MSMGGPDNPNEWEDEEPTNPGSKEFLETRRPGLVLVLLGRMSIGFMNELTRRGWSTEVSKTSAENRAGQVELTLPNAIFKMKRGGSQIDLIFPDRPAGANALHLNAGFVEGLIFNEGHARWQPKQG